MTEVGWWANIHSVALGCRRTLRALESQQKWSGIWSSYGVYCEITGRWDTVQVNQVKSQASGGQYVDQLRSRSSGTSPIYTLSVHWYYTDRLACFILILTDTAVLSKPAVQDIGNSVVCSDLTDYNVLELTFYQNCATKFRNSSWMRLDVHCQSRQISGQTNTLWQYALNNEIS